MENHRTNEKTPIPLDYRGGNSSVRRRFGNAVSAAAFLTLAPIILLSFCTFIVDALCGGYSIRWMGVDLWNALASVAVFCGLLGMACSIAALALGRMRMGIATGVLNAAAFVLAPSFFTG